MSLCARILEGRNRTAVLLISAAMLIGVALVDWWAEHYFSLGFLYLFPIMLSARYLPRWGIVASGVLCAVLSQVFSHLDRADALIRFNFHALALVGCGLFVAELVRNRCLSQEVEQIVRVLVEINPSPTLTVDESGLIERANRAAAELMAPPGGKLIGQPLAAFLPQLHYAFQQENLEFGTPLQCRCQRGDGQLFAAEIWFDTYRGQARPKRAAVIAAVRKEAAEANSQVRSVQSGRVPLNDRELQVLRLVAQGMANKEIAAALDISDSVVKNVLQLLFGKTEVRSRSQLVRVALERYRDLL